MARPVRPATQACASILRNRLLAALLSLPLAACLDGLTPSFRTADAAPAPGLDLYGDPLPGGVIARMGTVGFQRGDMYSTIAYSPDGALFAAAGFDGKIHIVETARWKEARVLSGHAGEVFTIAFSPAGGGILASGGDDKTLRLWDAATGRALARTDFQERGGKVYTVAFSPKGELLASGQGTGAIRLWSVGGEGGSLKEAGILDGHKERVTSLAFAPDGKQVVSASMDRTVRLWDVAARREAWRLADLAGPARTVAFSPDGKSIAWGGSDLGIHVTQLSTRQETGRLTDQAGGVNNLAFSPDGKLLAAAGQDKTVRVRDAADGKVLRSYPGLGDGVTCVAFSPDGKTLAAAGGRTAIRFWDAASGQEIRPVRWHEREVMAVAFSPDGKTLATGGLDRTVRLWDAATGAQRAVLSGHKGGVEALAFSGDGALLASGGDDGSLRVWEASTQAALATFEDYGAAAISLAFSRGDRLLAVGDEGGTLRIYEVRRQANAPGKAELVEKRKVLAPPFGIISIAFTGEGDGPDAGKIITDHLDYSIRVWDAASGRSLGSLASRSGCAMAVSPDETLVVAGDWDGTLRIWRKDPAGELSGMPLKLKGHNGCIYAAVFSPGGDYLATGGGDDVTKIWKVSDLLAGAATPLVLDGHAQRVGALAFSRDGARLAAGNDDRTALVWDIRSLMAAGATGAAAERVAVQRETVAKESLEDYRAAPGAEAKPALPLADWSNGFAISRKVAAGGRAVDVACSGRTLFAAVEDNGVALVAYDLADPALPKQIGRLDVGEGAIVRGDFAEGKLFVENGLALIAQNRPSRVDIVSVADPRAMKLVGTFPTKSDPSDVCMTPGGLGLVSTWSGVCNLLDLRNPAAPRKIADIPPPMVRFGSGRLEPEKFATGAAIQGRIAYVTTWCHGRFLSFDLSSNLAEPRMIGTNTHCVGKGWDYLYRGIVDGNRAYVSADQFASIVGGAHVLDISDPTRPRLLGFFSAKGYGPAGGLSRWWTRDIACSGTFLFVTDRAYGVACLDTARPEAIVKLGQAELPDARGVAIGPGAAYVAAGTAGIAVLEPNPKPAQ